MNHHLIDLHTAENVPKFGESLANLRRLETEQRSLLIEASNRAIQGLNGKYFCLLKIRNYLSHNILRCIDSDGLPAPELARPSSCMTTAHFSTGD